MPASRQTSEPFNRADEGVSEVIGQILMFGILSLVLVLSMLSFNIAKERTEDRVVETTAESIAQRIASLVIETALFAEKFEAQDIRLESRLELPARIEGQDYTITLDGAVVTVATRDAVLVSPLFAAGSEGLVHVCAQAPIEGGDIIIRIVAEPTPLDAVANLPAACIDSPLPPEPQFYVYLEHAP